MSAVKRIGILYPDASVMLMSGALSEATALAQARRECQIMNKGERDPQRLAKFGEIMVDLGSFKERF